MNLKKGVVVNWEAIREKKHVIIPNGVEEIPPRAFKYSCVKTVWIPASVKRIGCEAFYTCMNLTTVLFARKSKLEIIDDKAFNSCWKLRHIKLPASVNTIGDFSFTWSGVKKVHIPGNLTNWGEFSFARCKNLKNVTVDEGVSFIPSEAFESDYHLKSVLLPTTLNTIGVASFCDCHSLKKIKLPATLETIREGAFYRCMILKKIVGLSSTKVRILPTRVFGECYNLIDIQLPKKLAIIGVEAFFKCKHLKEISIPKSVIMLGDRFIADCESLQKLKISYAATSNVGSNWVPQNLNRVIFDDFEVVLDNKGNFVCKGATFILDSYLTSICQICEKSGNQKAIEAMVSYTGMALGMTV